jgi:hypothetical protein
MKRFTTYGIQAGSKKIYLLQLCIVWVSFASTANAQSSSLHGVIKDEQTLFPLEKVSVELHAAKDSSQLTGTVTNSYGVFALNKIQQGNYYVLIKSVSLSVKDHY